MQMTHKFICVSNQVTTENASFDILSTRITEIKQWVFDNQRKLNYEKTAFIIIGTAMYLSKVKSKYLAVGDINIEKNSIIRNLEVRLDEHLSMVSHINNVCKSACYHLRNIVHIGKYLTRDTDESIIHSFVTSRLDYLNSLLYGVSSTY